MSLDSFATQLLALSTGTLAVTAALLVWRRSLAAATRIIAVQGVALAALVVSVAAAERDAELIRVALVVLAIKGVAIPLVLGRGVRATGTARDSDLGVNPTAGLVGVTVLATLAYVVSRPITFALADGPHAIPAAAAVPIGMMLVLVGMQLVVTRRRALSQLVGFLVLDNGIAAVAFLTAAGVPFVVELGVSLDVLLIAIILAVLSGRLHAVLGAVGVGELNELRD